MCLYLIKGIITVIENPYIIINELGNMVEPEFANEDLELEDISNLNNEIHLNEQEFDDVFFNVGEIEEHYCW